MTTKITRRQFGLGLLAGATITIAGCGSPDDRDDDEDDDGDDEPPEDPLEDDFIDDTNGVADDGVDPTDDTDPDDGPEETEEIPDGWGDGELAAEELDLASPSSYAYSGEATFDEEEERMDVEFRGHVGDDGSWYLEQTSQLDADHVFTSEYVFIDGSLLVVTEAGTCETTESAERLTFQGNHYELFADLVAKAGVGEETTLDGLPVYAFDFDTDLALETVDIESDRTDELLGTIFVDRGATHVIGVDMTHVEGPSEAVSSVQYGDFDGEFSVDRPSAC